MEVKSLQENVYEAIRQGIASEEYKPGERLVEVQLARRYGVTRGPVREALCRLEHDGVVMRQAGIGVFVNDFDRSSLLELSEIRAALESLAARKAAARCDEVGAIRLRRQLDKLRQMAEQAGASSPVTRREFMGYDEELHLLIAEIAERPLLKRLLENQHIIRRMLQGTMPLFPESFGPDELEAILQRHVRLVEAVVANREKEAEELAREHVLRAAHRASRILNSHEVPCDEPVG